MFKVSGRVLFWSGVFMLVAAGVVWAASGGIKAFADSQLIKSRTSGDQLDSGSCDTPGCYSEEWVGEEVFGLLRADTDTDTGSKWSDNLWESGTGMRTCTTTTSATRSVGDNTKTLPISSCTYRAGNGNAYIDGLVNSTVTKWVVNGHVH